MYDGGYLKRCLQAEIMALVWRACIAIAKSFVRLVSDISSFLRKQESRFLFPLSGENTGFPRTRE